MYQFTDGALRNVWLENGYVERDTRYGPAVSFDDLDGLVEALSQALVNKPGKLSGPEFRYLRTHSQLTQKALGKLLGYSEQAIAKWEKGATLPRAVDLVLRLLCKRDNKDLPGAVAEWLEVIAHRADLRVILSLGPDGWTFRFVLPARPASARVTVQVTAE